MDSDDFYDRIVTGKTAYGDAYYAELDSYESGAEGPEGARFHAPTEQVAIDFLVVYCSAWARDQAADYGDFLYEQHKDRMQGL